MLAWALAPVFGALYGIAELAPRYRDAPLRAICTRPGALYVLVNSAGSVGALAVVRALDLDLGLASGSGRDVMQTLVAGFGAMAVFRSSIFIARIGDSDVAIGPVAVLQTLLGVLDRGIDRTRAQVRAVEIRSLMADVSIEQATFDLPQLAFGLMQNVPQPEQVRAAAAAEKILNSDCDVQTKIYMLGVALMNVTGRDALVAAVGLLRSKPIMQADSSRDATTG